MNKNILISIIAIIIILIVAFLSQQAYSGKIGKTLISDATKQATAYLTKGSNLIMSNVYPKISGEVQKRGAVVNNEVIQQKQNVSENLGKKIGNYFSGITNSVIHPGTPQNCSTPQSSTGQ